MGEGHTSRGKWSENSVPHKGWNCVGVDDLEEPSQLCQMCESVEIRYVHFMEHPDYTETLAVGCVCAEHMEDDYVRPREREKDLRRLSGRRRSWAGRKWRISQNGNSYINTEGFNIVIYNRDNGFVVSVARRESGKRQAGKQIYPALPDAKASALKALLWAKSHL
ncbi:hypothetical protein RMS29_025385 (plasmid) [Agrobacterium rosae]|uniref:AP2 domain protein n=2 Tax=Agrobacterium rosae TaxID=1972867 RepID=A0ABU4W4B6_9HYPH|nr:MULTISPECIES: hypothetical protein [Agrobacterium]MDX8310899.1 hypothetical protein [Agrobacterium sp. rho-13.3]MDX8332600.1 hypothetical protein [Agrobacterium rosae]